MATKDIIPENIFLSFIFLSSYFGDRVKARKPSAAKSRGVATKAPARAASPAATRSAASQLANLFRRNGYLRPQNKSRLKKEGYGEYKKGDELRFTANSKAELNLIRGLLHKLGFQPPRPFVKDNQFRQPIYSRSAIEGLLQLMRIRE